MAKSTADESSERKRISIPKADESVLAWWDEQKDPALSVRLLIRGEIERSGYTDTAYRPVAQLPRRGRPPADFIDSGEASEAAAITVGPTTTEAVIPRAAPVVAAVPTPVETPAPMPVPEPAPTVSVVPSSPVNQDTFRTLDDIMNG